MSHADIRVRRPKKHEALLLQMRDEGGFPTMRDVLLFAASVGQAQQRRQPYDDSAEPIRYETLTEPTYADTLVNMIAAVNHSKDAEILAAGRLGERVSVFEEFANGGLDFIQEQVGLRALSLEVLLLALVSEALDQQEILEPISVEKLLEGLS